MAKELFEEIITVKLTPSSVEHYGGGSGGITRVPHRLLGVPNIVKITGFDADGGGATLDANISLGALTATYITVVNTHDSHPIIRMHAKRFKADQADIGMSSDYDYSTEPPPQETPTTSDGIDNFSYGEIYDGKSLP